MSCHVMSCHVMSCHIMSCHIMSCHIMSYKPSLATTSLCIDTGGLMRATDIHVILRSP